MQSGITGERSRDLPPPDFQGIFFLVITPGNDHYPVFIMSKVHVALTMPLPESRERVRGMIASLMGGRAPDRDT
jgi:hypothetical protein